MQFIKGTPMVRKAPYAGKLHFVSTNNEVYINPRHIESAVYDPEENATAIRMTGSGANAILKGNVMREYEEQIKGRQQQGDGSED